MRRLALSVLVALSGCGSDEPGGASPGNTAGKGAGQSGASGQGATAGVANGGTATGGSSTGGTAGAGGAATGAGTGGTAGRGAGGAAGQGGLASVGGSAGATAGSSGRGAGGAPNAAGASAGGEDALAQLRAYLLLPRDTRPELGEQPFASVALTKGEASTATELLWDDHTAFIRDTRKAETDAKALKLGDKTMRYDFKEFGSAPATGHSLYISLHGGGEAEPSVNDEQWENQKILYEPDEAIYLAPRAPTDTWNLWHEAHIDPLLDRLIEDLIVFEGIDSNRVYVMGYSAGGDGVYQLGPRMADSWAAAAMMAGHPNDAKPDSLRNIGFTIHVGGMDTAYDRNTIAAEWGVLLDDLAAADPGAYAHEVQVHPDKGHWMDLEDAVAVPWMAEFTRDPLPDKIVWLQDDVPHERFYWLAVPAGEAVKATKVVATRDGQTITLEADGVKTLDVRLSDGLVDLDRPVTVKSGSTTLFSGSVPRTIGILAKTLTERGDLALTFAAELELALD